MQLTIAKLLIIKGQVFVNYLCLRKKEVFLEKKQITMVYVILEV